MKAQFIGGPLDGEVDPDAHGPEWANVVLVRGANWDHVYRVVKQFRRTKSGKNKFRIRYVYWGTEDQLSEEGGED